MDANYKTKFTKHKNCLINNHNYTEPAAHAQATKDIEKLMQEDARIAHIKDTEVAQIPKVVMVKKNGKMIEVKKGVIYMYSLKTEGRDGDTIKVKYYNYSRDGKKKYSKQKTLVRKKGNVWRVKSSTQLFEITDTRINNGIDVLRDISKKSIQSANKVEVVKELVHDDEELMDQLINELDSTDDLKMITARINSEDWAGGLDMLSMYVEAVAAENKPKQKNKLISKLKELKNQDVTHNTVELGKLMDRHLQVLGATKKDKTAKINTDLFTKQDRDVMESKESAREFAEMIDEIAVQKEEDPAHKEALLGVLDSIVGEGFMPKEVNVYLAKNQKNTVAQFSPSDNKTHNTGVYLALGKKSADGASSLEKYVHEMLHAVELFAVESKNPRIATAMARINKVHAQFAKNAEAKLIAAGASQSEARKIASYTSDQKEFMAYGLTNKYVVKALQNENVYGRKKEGSGLWETLKQIVSDIIDTALSITRHETKDLNGFEALNAMSKRVWEVNNLAEDQVRKAGLGEKIADTIDTINTSIAKAMEGISSKLDIGTFTPLRKDAGKIETSAWILKNIFKIYNNPMARAHYENVLNIASPKYLGHDSTLQHIMRSFSKNDSYMDIIEDFGLRSQNIDRLRGAQDKHVINSLSAVLDGKMIEQEERDLTNGLIEVDLQSLSKTDYKLAELYKDDDYLDSKIKKLEDALEGTQRQKNYFLNQSRALGHTLVTGEVGKVQLRNAQAIARELNGKRVKLEQVPKGLEQNIDRLVTLYAIKELDKDTKESMGTMLTTRRAEVMHVFDTHRAFVESSMESQFGKNKINSLKGYSAELYNPDVDVKFAPITDKAKMKAEGYEFKYELGQKFGTKTMALYANKKAKISEYNKQAVRTTNTQRRGTSIADILMADEKEGLKSKETDIKTLQMKEKTIKRKMETHMNKEMNEMYSNPNFKMNYDGSSATYDTSGRVKTFRYEMTKKNKREVLERDEKVQFVLGSMFSGEFDKIESAKHNNDLVHVVIEDMKINYDWHPNILAKNYKDYVMMGNPDEADTELYEQWLLIPSSTRRKLKKEMEKTAEKMGIVDYEFKGVPIRADLRRMLLGERDATLANLLPSGITPAVVKTWIKETESLWKDVIQVIKLDIVIRTPKVWIGNAISNAILSVQMGMPITDVFKLQKEGLYAVKEYEKMEKELFQVKGEAVVSTGIKKKRAEDKIKRLTVAMENNSVYDLVQAGFLSSIVEDTRAADTKQHSILGRNIEKAHNKIGNSAVKSTINWLWLTEETTAFKAMMKITQYGDFLSRYALHYATMEKQKRQYKEKNGKNASVATVNRMKTASLRNVRDAFVNYNINDTKNIKWLNDMGFIMFTKFWLRIQKVVKKAFEGYPTQAFLGIFAQWALATDLDDVMDHSFIDYDESIMIKDPIQMAEKTFLAVPHIFQFPDRLYKGLTEIAK